MNPHTPINCPECGKPVPANSPHQACPACLMAQAFASRTRPGEPSPESTVPPRPEEIADKFPQFEITECLGRGGMGVVYKARQKSLNRWVAIKILAPERIGDERFAERFSREAQTLAQLNHPNIVTVYDYGETDGLYFIVMEFVDGVNLRDLLRDGKIQPEQALAIIPPVCEALQFAHEKGIVHRDIKPENLLVDRDGRIKIADFGIAALVGASDESAGTPPYMAPEQEQHSKVDHRADIYALGAVLYEMLTGERPATPLDLPSQKVRLDIRIDDIVLRALSRDPERRYRTAADFRTVVQTLSPGQGTSPPPPVPPPPAAPFPSTPLDPRIRTGLGIAMIVVGSITILTLLGTLLVLPFAGGAAHSIGRMRSFGPGMDLIHSGGMAPFWSVGVALVLSMLFSFTVSILSILGGRQMYLEGSRNWSFVGAAACCITPLWWPLGLLVGGAAIAMLVMENKKQSEKVPPPGATDGGPRISAMAVFAAGLQIVPIILIILATLLAVVYSARGGML